VAELATIVLLMSAYSGPRSLMKVLFRALAVVTLLDIGALALKSSHTPIGYQGIHGHKNQAGSFAFFALPVFAFAFSDRHIARWRFVPLMLAAATVFILVLSQSKTGVVATILAAAFAIGAFCLTSGARWIAIGFAGLLAAAIAGVVFFSGIPWTNLVTTFTGDPTFTGRQEIWDFMMARIAQHPFIGYGFGSFWGVGAETDLALQQANITFYYGQAHNGYLDVAADLGLAGLAAVAVMFSAHALKLLRLLRTRTETSFAIFAAYVMSGFAIYNLTESALFRPGTDLWIYYLVTVQAAMCFAPARSAETKAPAQIVTRRAA